MFKMQNCLLLKWLKTYFVPHGNLLFQSTSKREKTHSNFPCQNNVKILLVKAFSKLNR